MLSFYTKGVEYGGTIQLGWIRRNLVGLSFSVRIRQLTSEALKGSILYAFKAIFTYW